MPKSTGRKRKQREAEQRDAQRPSRAGNGGQEKTQGAQNVGEFERAISSALGGALLIGGLKRWSLPGLAIAATGAAFLYRGATGHCTVYESLGMDTHRNRVNADRSEGLSHEAAGGEDSINEDELSSKPRRTRAPKKMTSRDGMIEKATVASFAQK